MFLTDQKRWRIASHAVMILLSTLALMPFVLLIISSFTDERVALINGYSFWPEKLSLDAYRYILDNREVFFRAYGITFLVTAIGVPANVSITSLTGYVLSKRKLPGVKILNFMVIFTMLFNGGLVATYVSYVTIFGIKDTLFALLVPSLLMSSFMVMLVRNYFEHSIPGEIYESARMDGANEFLIFFRLVLPLSTPILATVGLMMGIAYWNDWQNSLYYIDDRSLYSVQAVLNAINESIAVLASLAEASGVSAAELPTSTIRMAVATVGILPILITYPFFQKYFAKGLMAGSIKG